MAQLAVHIDFLSEFNRWDRDTQKRVREAVIRLQADESDAEPVAGARDERLRTVWLDDQRSAVVAEPGIRTLFHVAGHEDATDWARRHRISVNEVTGVVQTTDVDELERVLPEYRKAADEAPARLFDRIKDPAFRRLGVDSDVVAVARTVRTLDQLRTLERALPEAQYTALYLLGDGFFPDDVWAQHIAPQLPDAPVDPGDLAAAIARSRGRVAVVDGSAELLELFDRPFARWRVFLNPGQDDVAYRPSYSGSAKVSGGPGTGKSVVALHRVRHLVTRSPLPPASVLLTTFSPRLADDLDRDLTQLLDATGRAAVRVVTVDGLAHEVVTARHGAPRYVDQEGYRRVWADASRRTGGRFSGHFLRREWETVVCAQRIGDLDGYLAADRRGRGQRLASEQKRQLWPALQEASRALRATGTWTPLTVADEAATLVTEPLFRHVVVDEAQDLNPAQWRLLRASVAPGPDDLFLAGDPHQRIYGHRVTLRSMGIDTAGRSVRLTANHRTTTETLAWALRVLEEPDSDDLDGGVDSLLGYRSSAHGAAPEVKGFATPAAELAGLVETVRGWHADQVDWSGIGVAARTGRVAQSARAALAEAGIPVANDDNDDSDGVVVATMHGLKGLEFRCVALVGVNDGAVPDPRALTPEHEDPLGYLLDLRQERSLLFVAATRARELLTVTWSGAPSPLLPA